ncbi:MAG TPA: hypothetical protein DHV28_15285 [Ignavibacteriales bacterium]|nr:hypothetical protein [Ignavibacteriales bacterium]
MIKPEGITLMKFLTEKTQVIFNELAEEILLKDFTFVGGSAISYYLKHRLSEDLDFFTWQNELPAILNELPKKLSRRHKVDIANISSVYADFIIDDAKITFFANDWEVLKENRTNIIKNIFIADLKLLCAMKINTLSLRAKYRDYYDLYVINKEKYSLKDIYNFASFYIPGMNKKVFGMELTYIKDIEDENINHLYPKYQISLTEIKKHFETEFAKFL